MAVRDRNMAVWQAYVIAVSIVSFIIAGLLVWSLISGGDNRKMAEAAKADAEKARRDVSSLGTKIQVMQSMLGSKQYSQAEFDQMLSTVGEDADITPLKQQFDTDMALFGPDVAAQDRSYTRLGGYLMEALRDRNQLIDEIAKAKEALNADVEKIRETERAAREAAEAQVADLEKKLAHANQEVVTVSDNAAKELDQLTAQLEKSKKDAEKATLALNRELTSVKNENTELLELKKELIERIAKDIDRVDYETHQGRIIDVDRKGVTAFINIGSKNGLTPGIIFSVLSSDTVRISDAKPKAKIEVVEVINENMSKVRVIPDRLNVPVLPDDWVYSPTWGAGRKKTFALLGRLDMTGDGLDDRERLKALITQNGGEVVEDLGPDGKSLKSGEGMTINTSYLILGDRPRIDGAAALDDRTKGLMDAYGIMETRANKLGVTILTIDKLLGMLRVSEGDRMVGVGEGLSESDFKGLNPPKRTAVPTLQEQFRTRQPKSELGQ